MALAGDTANYPTMNVNCWALNVNSGMVEKARIRGSQPDTIRITQITFHE